MTILAQAVIATRVELRDAGGLDHCLEVFSQFFERELDLLTVGQAASAQIVPYEGVASCQRG